MRTFLYYLAQTPKLDPGKLPKDTSFEVLAGILNTTYFIAGSLAVITIILAGYQFSTAVYDPAKISIAKNALLYAVVGLIVVLLAFVITQFVMGRF
ncbi:hypothetical protein HGB25_00495 [Candidatus Saccharibacteria bacterium]|nr:hypothetical protein [Candidatus Saccharibacteria bacterium]